MSNEWHDRKKSAVNDNCWQIGSKGEITDLEKEADHRESRIDGTSDERKGSDSISEEVEEKPKKYLEIPKNLLNRGIILKIE